MINSRFVSKNDSIFKLKLHQLRVTMLAVCALLLTSVAFAQTPPLRPSRATTNTTAPGSPESYSLYTPELNLMAQTAPSTAPNPPVAREIVWFGGQPVAQIDAGSAEVRTTFTDHLGTPVLQTNASSAVVWRAEYEPYGGVREIRAGSSADQPLRLPGQEVAMMSEGSEENYNIFRWYRAGWGQYTQPDPDGISMLVEPYGFARRRPLLLTDRYGLNAGTVASPLWNFCETAASQGAYVASASGAMFVGMIFAATATSQLADLSDAFPTTCQKCGKTKREGCEDACEKAFIIRYDICSKRYSGNPYLQQECYKKAAKLNADCMKGCYELFGK